MKFRFLGVSVWNNKFILRDDAENIIGFLNPKSWFGSSSILSLYKNSYTLLWKNTPLAGLEIKDYKGRVIIDIKIAIEKDEINTTISVPDSIRNSVERLLLYCIAFYLFLPINFNTNGGSDALLAHI